MLYCKCVLQPIPVWEKLDTELYQFHLQKNLSELFSRYNCSETLSLLANLIPGAFIEAAKASTDFKSPKQPKKLQKAQVKN